MRKEYLIGDFLKRIKRPIDLQPDQEYKLVTIKMNHKGVELRGQKKGRDIKSKMFEVKEGDFILSGIDARNGAFGIVGKELESAIVTNDFWYFEIDEDVISKQLFLELTATTWFDEICQKGSDGTTQRIRLQKDKFFNQKILLPERDEQEDLLSKISIFKKGQTSLNKEIELQKTLTSQLKQSILQEAILGKLTKEWRSQNQNIEPASKLLDRIKAAKAQLIKEKKINKEKPLHPITDEEIPFEIPESWVWCKLGDVLLYSDAGKSPHCEKRPATQNEWGVLTTTAIQNGYFQESANKVLPVGFNVNLDQKVCLDDILITRAGPLNRTGISCKVQSISSNLILSDKTIRLKHPKDLINPDFISSALNSSHIRSLLIPKMTGMAESQVNISQKNIKLTPVPVPPLEEQKAIVEKVEELMQKCQQLEEEIEKSEDYANQLMQALLKEAFSSEKELTNLPK